MTETRALIQSGKADKHFQMRPVQRRHRQDRQNLCTGSADGVVKAGTSSSDAQLISACRQRQCYLSYKTDFSKTARHYSSDNCLFDN
ncbi:hypothetical protein FJW08_20150 [Mesorhizobium sp. B3-2-1]|uniref:hypothetical protein n=1 Tax=Mesorhizobium sp. B3-2-1 TaxID=2589891 RepID=UPI001126A2C6|nr:hypothetical protein [Mesorhizobium sp. B3-2-1]TPI28697.1 hypothetical protein FJW08_20150 [Mesorhizobium sp. B3-2-1]